MATEVKKVKFVYFDYVHPKAFHLTSYQQNLFFDLCQLYWKITWDHLLKDPSKQLEAYKNVLIESLCFHAVAFAILRRFDMHI